MKIFGGFCLWRNVFISSFRTNLFLFSRLKNFLPLLWYYFRLVSLLSAFNSMHQWESIFAGGNSIASPLLSFALLLCFHLISAHLFHLKHLFRWDSKETDKKKTVVLLHTKKKRNQTWTKNGKTDVFLFQFYSLSVQFHSCSPMLLFSLPFRIVSLCSRFFFFWPPRCWALFQFLFTLGTLFRHYTSLMLIFFHLRFHTFVVCTNVHSFGSVPFYFYQTDLVDTMATEHSIAWPKQTQWIWGNL